MENVWPLLQGFGAKARTTDADHQDVLVLTQVCGHRLDLRQLRRHFVREIERGVLDIKAGAAAGLHAPLRLFYFRCLGGQLRAADAFTADAVCVEVGRVDHELRSQRNGVKHWMA